MKKNRSESKKRSKTENIIKTDKVTVIDLQNIKIGDIAVFKLPEFKKVKSAQSVICFYNKTKQFGKKWTTQSRKEDNLLIIKAEKL